MKNKLKIKENNDTFPYLYSNKKNLSYYLLEDNFLTLSFYDLNLNEYNDAEVYLKNIKTKEFLKCSSKINNNTLFIDLSSLSYLCTDYEFSILIVLFNTNCTIAINPILKSNSIISNSIRSFSNNSNIKWYIRFLENGKVRLSTVYLFSKIENESNTKILQ